MKRELLSVGLTPVLFLVGWHVATCLTVQVMEMIQALQ